MSRAEPGANAQPLDGNTPPSAFDGTLPYFPYGKPQQASMAAARPGRSGPRSILFAWELGAGLGHLMQMLPLAQYLVKAGHRVGVALRELDRAGELYAWGVGAGLWPARRECAD